MTNQLIDMNDIKKFLFPIAKWGYEKTRLVYTLSMIGAMIGYTVSSIVIKNDSDEIEIIEEEEINNEHV